MNALTGKTPFLRLLIPVVAGILTGSSFPHTATISFPLFLSGMGMMLLTFFIKPQRQYPLRWVFGAGCLLCFFSLSLYQTGQHEQYTQLDSSRYGQYALGTILEIPTEKTRSIAVNLITSSPDPKKIVLYLEKNDEARSLTPGDEIVFRGKLQPFRNQGNPDDFDYARFMKMKGFAGSGYVSATNWEKTGRQRQSIYTLAQRARAHVIDFYRSFELDDDAYAFICAITLGYKAHLSDNLQEAFRASGTAHVLALSGLHVGIIYAVIHLLFAFMGQNDRFYMIRQWLAIVALWIFVFVVGMPPSVMRAAIMLTLFSFVNLYHRNRFSYNSLAAAAFLILILNPSSLFDVGFQMSFSAVFAILFFNPKLTQLYQPTNRVKKYIRDLICINTTAQLGVSPFVLYYFGTFPTWFFFTNLLVVPLVGVIIYAAFPLILTALLKPLGWSFMSLLYEGCLWIEKSLIELLLRIVYISESLPLAQISDIKISLLQLALLLLIIYPFALYITSHRAKPLIISMAALLTFHLTLVHDKLRPTTPQLMVFNSPGRSEIALYHHQKRHYVPIPENGLIPDPQKRILFLSARSLPHHANHSYFKTDILIISGGNNSQRNYVNMKALANLFNPDTIVLDSSVPRHLSNFISRQCASLGVGFHDVSQNGAFTISRHNTTP